MTNKLVHRALLCPVRRMHWNSMSFIWKVVIVIPIFLQLLSQHHHYSSSCQPFYLVGAETVQESRSIASISNHQSSKRRRRKTKDVSIDETSILSTSTNNQKTATKSRTIGTRITGIGSHGIRNRSIFSDEYDNQKSPYMILEKTLESLGVGNNQNEDVLRNSMRGKIYAKLQSKGGIGKVMLYIQGNSHDQHEDHIISLSTRWNQQDNKPTLHAEERTSSDTSIPSLDQWIPIEGVYGIYVLPSGLHLVLITDSEEVYESPPVDHDRSGKSPALLKFRRIRSMEIVPIPTMKRYKPPALSMIQQSVEARQYRLLRHSLREHSFYFIPLSSSSSSLNGNIVKDMTHTLQRSFSHWDGEVRRRNDRRHQSMRQSLLNYATNDEEQNRIKWVVDKNHLVKTRYMPMNTMNNGNAIKAISRALSMATVREVDDTIQSNHLSLGNPTVINLSIDSYKPPTINDHDENRQRPDSRFFWNEDCLQPILDQLYQHDETSVKSKDHTSSPYGILLDQVVPVTSAFVGVQRNIKFSPSNKMKTKPENQRPLVYDQLLISRRSKFRAGTRFTKRGADSTGAVANYAETEQICIIHDGETTTDTPNSIKEVYSHVQTRGSIPLRWSSPADIKYRPRVLIGIDPIAQANALWNHVVEQIVLYTSSHFSSRLVDDKSQNYPVETSKLVFVNLIDKHSDQGRLGRTFESVLSAVLDVYGRSDMSLANLAYHIWFDFHAECKNGRWDKLKILLESASKSLDTQGYFCAIPFASNALSHSESSWKIVNTQDGVVRTNCMDCLDRTNVVQALFGRYILYKQFNERRGLVASSPSPNSQRVASKRNMPLEYVIGYKQNALSLPWKKGEKAHRLLWADNADHISRLYAGTPALKGDFTRTGQRTKRGALDDGMNSLQRYYLNNFIDADRQEGMDLLTGYLNFDNGTDEYFDNEIGVRSSRYNERAKKISKRKTHDFSQMPGLSWLSGDLQSQLRTSSTHQGSNQFSPSEALRDIDRRSSSNHPWWDLESLDSNGDALHRVAKRKRSTKKKQHKRARLLKDKDLVISDGKGSSLVALAAATQAPFTTAIGIVLLTLPGILSK